MRMRLKLLLIFLSCLFVGILNAQNAKVDSLANLLKNYTTEDTVKANLLNELAYAVVLSAPNQSKEYSTQANIIAQKTGFRKGEAESLWLLGASVMNNDKTLALEFYQKALEIFQEINNRSGIAKCFNNMGIVYKSLGNKEKELLFYQKALEIAEEQKDQPGIARYLNNISLYHSSLGNYDKAIEGLEKSLIIMERLNDIPLISRNLNNLGTIYAHQGNNPKALEYFQRSLKIAEQQNDKMSIINALLNISTINLSLSNDNTALENLHSALEIAEEINDYSRIAGCLLNIGKVYQKTDYAQALEYFQRALDISEKHNYVAIRLASLIYISDLYLEQDKIEIAYEMLQKALTVSESIGEKRSICKIWKDMGGIFLKQKDYAKALHFTRNSLKLANELQLLNEQRDIHGQLSEIFSATNDFKKAYNHQRVFKNLDDSINNRDNFKKIAELEASYKYEKEKQALAVEQQRKDVIQEAERKQQRVLIFALFAGFILLTILIAHLYRSYHVKHEMNIILTKQKLEIEEKNTKLQELNATKDKFFSIIAHDLRGSFNTILGFSDLISSCNDDYNQKDIITYANVVNSSAKNSFSLLENLLEWAMSNSKIMDFKPQYLDLKPFIAENENTWKSLALAKNITINYAVPDNLLVYADSNMLNTILRNLLTNAIKFTQNGGKVTISSLQREKEIEITVSDTGIGMNNETRSKLFKINEKASSLGTENEAGTGLGLLLCKEFVEKHNGKIWCMSELGNGSDFKFTLPLS